MKISALIFILAVTLSSAATGGQNQNVKIALHVDVHQAKRACASLPALNTCEDIVTTFDGFDFDAMLVFYDLDGITGAEYGLTWPAWTYSCAFTSCSDLVIGSIVWPGDGISHSWSTCQVKNAVIVGWCWFYADSAGKVCPISHPGSGFIGVTDCEFVADSVRTPRCSGVYGETGDDPCELSDTESGAWDGVKEVIR